MRRCGLDAASSICQSIFPVTLETGNDRCALQVSRQRLAPEGAIWDVYRVCAACCSFCCLDMASADHSTVRRSATETSCLTWMLLISTLAYLSQAATAQPMIPRRGFSRKKHGYKHLQRNTRLANCLPAALAVRQVAAYHVKPQNSLFPHSEFDMYLLFEANTNQPS